ncbi:hypothetical protein GQ53DRAFT_665327 [Thozetella sp. PMI_491]|nr:hypothetical protein GQ53DRAFT_665327 [Thozetella sp. PMI_491]
MAVDPPAAKNEEAAAGAENGDDGPAGKSRFIAFIGNLPYSATKESVSAHFVSLRPSDVRVLTERGNPKKCRGMAFVEFDNYDRMKTCLEKFHHTEFNDGISPVRKINVELTAGGGGKTADRQDKIKEKNRKLNEERIRRTQREEAAKLERQKEAKAKAQTVEEKEENDIHPSRRGRVPVRGKKW